MRSRFLFPGDVILKHATTVELTIYRNHGETIGVHYKVAGDILSPFRRRPVRGWTATH